MQLVKNHKVKLDQGRATLEVTPEPQEILTRQGWEKVADLESEHEREVIKQYFAVPRMVGRVILGTGFV